MSNITQKWVNVFKAYSSNYNGKLSASQISKNTKIPQQTVSRIMNQMVKDNVVRFIKEGRNKLFYLDKNAVTTKPLVKIIECQKSVDFLLKNKNISLIVKDLLKKFKCFIIFGSYASGKNKKSSDLDILIFSKKKSIRDIKSKYSIDINEHFITFAEFKRMKNNTLIKEVIMNHVLFGDFDNVIEVFL